MIIQPSFLHMFGLKLNDHSKIHIMTGAMQGAGKVVLFLDISSSEVFSVWFDPSLDFSDEADWWLKSYQLKYYKGVYHKPYIEIFPWI